MVFLILTTDFPIPLNLPQMQRKLRHLRHTRPLVKILHRHIRRHSIAVLGKDRIHQPRKHIAVVPNHRQRTTADIIRKLLFRRRWVQREKRGQKLCDLRSFFRGYRTVRLGSFRNVAGLLGLARDCRALDDDHIARIVHIHTETS